MADATRGEISYPIKFAPKGIFSSQKELDQAISDWIDGGGDIEGFIAFRLAPNVDESGIARWVKSYPANAAAYKITQKYSREEIDALVNENEQELMRRKGIIRDSVGGTGKTEEGFGLLPVRCYTCGRLTADKQEMMEKWLKEGGDLESLYDFIVVPTHQLENYYKWAFVRNRYATQYKAFKDLIINVDRRYIQAYYDHIDSETSASAKARKAATEAKREQDAARKKGQRLDEADIYIPEPVLFLDVQYESTNITRRDNIERWLVGDFTTRQFIQGFLYSLSENGVLDQIYDALGILKKDRKLFTLQLEFGAEGDGFNNYHNIKPLPPCCRARIRPPPKIYI